MLPELKNFEDKITLIMDSGIQFMDFAITADLRKLEPGNFINQPSNRSLLRLLFDERKEIHVHPGDRHKAVVSSLEVPMNESVDLLMETWLPVPVFQLSPPRRFAEGPINWARVCIFPLDPNEDPNGNTHRIVFAFDTKVFDDRDNVAYLAPTRRDIQSGATFALAHQGNEIGWFIEEAWFDAWIREVFNEQAPTRLRLDLEDVERDLENFVYQAHYLNLLHLLGSAIRFPEIKVQSHIDINAVHPIPVDMVLDVGNSRTCGILIESHPQQNDGLASRYNLELRDLSLPKQVYSEPFESRVEFAQATFGKDHFSVQSGRSDAFLWPTLARVGSEATRLSSRRRGNEGTTGLSSPKRYLWDEDEYAPGWRFNCAFNQAEIEPHATAVPVANLINDRGEALYTLAEEDRLPVFKPKYSRSSLMTFMLSEIVAQAVMQINSPAQRGRMIQASQPRHMRRIILTVPPSMPRQEREIFAKRMRQAVALVWKSLKWHPEDESDEGTGADLASPPLPEIEMRWDEATCGQVVYLYSEIQNNFGGRPEEFFAALARPGNQNKKVLTMATVDIGGGTTDLVISDYCIEGQGTGSNVYILPKQRFRDGFKVAGDDILLEVIQKFVVPALEAALNKVGVSDPSSFMSRLIGSENLDVQDAVMRQQIALQILYPIGLRILKEYEQYDPLQPGRLGFLTFAELLSEVESPSDKVLDHVQRAFRKEVGVADAEFDILATQVDLNLRRLHEYFIGDRMEITKAIKSLCEIVYLYNCDVLLLTGRPSRLPGIQAVFTAASPLPPGRIKPLNQYRTGPWYPFHRQGKINDPKTTASVGAMLCVLGQGSLPNFFFRAAAFKPYSTVRYIGLLDNLNFIKRDNVFYADVDLDNPDYELPEAPFEMRGPTRIGFRQLAAERWPGSPLYMLTFADEQTARQLSSEGGVLKVTLRNKKSARQSDTGTEKFEIDSVESTMSRSVSKRAIKLQLNTLADVGPGANSYWLDSGSVFK